MRPSIARLVDEPEMALRRTRVTRISTLDIQKLEEGRNNGRYSPRRQDHALPSDRVRELRAGEEQETNVIIGLQHNCVLH